MDCQTIPKPGQLFYGSKILTLPKKSKTISKKLAIPKVGEQLQIIPTYFENAELFFASIVTPTWKQELQSLNSRLNHPAEKLNLLKFSDPFNLPQNGELVFSEYIDGNFYRAKVINFYKDSKEYKVFYCDYGNFEMVRFEKLRQWESKYDFLPFQSVLCKLYNIKDDPLYRREVLELLSTLVNQQLVAEVKENENILVLDVRTEDKKTTITSELINKSLASSLRQEENLYDEEYIHQCFLKRDKYNIPDYLG